MKLFVSDIEESYRYTIIGYMVHSVTEDLLFHVVQYWFACEV